MVVLAVPGELIRPTDPGVPSGFLKLSPELRNDVYSILFRYPDPLMLTEDENGSVKLFRCNGDRNSELISNTGSSEKGLLQFTKQFKES